MNKVVIFYGSNKAFSTVHPNDFRNLTDVVTEMDEDTRQFVLKIDGMNNNTEETPKPKFENFVIFSDEYSGVREHVVINFANFLSKIEFDNLYIQNPPLHITEQLHRLYDKLEIIEEKTQEYSRFSKETLIKFNEEYDNVIIGQSNAKIRIMEALYSLTIEEKSKPKIILFYGDTGIGKTETANYLSKLLNGNIMRKQFSMFQNNQFSTYLFGGTNNESSFAKDLLDRDSNVVLLDEFDKANPIFHSAFYQLFDEGIYEDKNYKVNMENAIIICTSNYKSVDEIIDNLGDAIFNRFDAVIHFEDLSIESKKTIFKRIMLECKHKYPSNSLLSDDQLERLESSALRCNNVRAMRRLVENTLSLFEIRNLS